MKKRARAFLLALGMVFTTAATVLGDAVVVKAEPTEEVVDLAEYYGSEAFESQYTYEGNDLGATWTKDATTFRVWAPTADAVVVNLYQSGTEGTDDLIETIAMTADVNGTWVVTKDGDLNGTYYTYTVTIDGEQAEACDPYAKTTGVNGRRAMVIDMDSTDPEDWEEDKNPNAELTINDAIIYELHVRDLGTDASSGITNVGKFLSLTEHGTTTSGGKTTGIDYIKELGITHLHILPMYDYASVDEANSEGVFNWGYDPMNYNVPEGSYSTDPYNGAVRVSETKQMIQSLHNDGISVIMDVVYNHVYDAESFCFNKLVPQYFSRVTNGIYSNGSACGNDTASERAMVKKYIVDSVLYWTEEYHMDGFRFDLVGLIDTETINEIMEEVHKVRPDVIFYGEGWTMNTKMVKEGYSLTTQTNSDLVPGFAFFNDTLRDALKGNISKNTDKGYVTGAMGYESTIQDCFIADARGWCENPTQTINYASCHDNNTLFDRLQESRKDASFEDLVKMNNLTAAIYMTAEGVPFLQAGEEMLRSKELEDGTFDHNSYKSPDSVNSIKWSVLEDDAYMDVVEYYKGLIAFRKAHGALRLSTAEDVAEHVTLVNGLDTNVTAFHITGGVNEETADAIYIIFNPNEETTDITLPEGDWNVYVNAQDAGTEILETVTGTVTVDAISAMVLAQESAEAAEEPTAPTEPTEKGTNMTGIILAAVAGAAAGVVIVMMKKKK